MICVCGVPNNAINFAHKGNLVIVENEQKQENVSWIFSGIYSMILQQILYKMKKIKCLSFTNTKSNKPPKLRKPFCEITLLRIDENLGKLQNDLFGDLFYYLFNNLKGWWVQNVRKRDVRFSAEDTDTYRALSPKLVKK